MNQALLYKPIQAFAVQKVISYLSEELKTDIKLTGVRFSSLKQVEFQGLDIKGQDGKDLFYAKKIRTKLRFSRLFTHSEINIKELDIRGARFHLSTEEEPSNIRFLIDYFSPEKEEPETKPLVHVHLSTLKIADSEFTYSNKSAAASPAGIDYEKLSLKKIFTTIRIHDYASNFIDFDIQNLRFEERSGLQLRRLSAQVKANSKRMEFNKLHLQTNRSTLKDYLRLSYDDFADFKDFIHRVNIQLQVKGSHISSQDIAYFAPVLDKIHFEASIPHANISGKIDHINARNILLHTAKATTFRGNLSIRDIPEMDRAQFTFDIAQLQSNSQDIQNLFRGLSDQASFELPDFLAKEKSLSYQGKLSGLYNNFLVQGLVKSQYGELNTKMQLDLRNNIRYAGQLAAENFQLGQLLASKDIEKSAFKLELEGSSLRLADMQASAKGSLRQFNFKGYSYEQISLDAQVASQWLQLTGQIKDPHAQITFNTELHILDRQAPYQLNASLENTDLKALKLLPQDSLYIHSAHVFTDMQGSHINNIIGQLHASEVQFSTRKGNFNIHDIVLTAEGDAINRYLDLKSDVVDARLLGTIDLTTISPYFKALAMRYAPAIGFDTTAYNTQNFDLDLQIKSFAPIATFFDPNLSLHQGAQVKAKFSTENFTAQINAFAPLLQYKDLTFHRVIIDENAQPEHLSILATADRMNFSDSSYINNINISNILSNDRLRYNVKLSEAASGNFLDLNGDILFAEQQPAYIQLAPSTILINKEYWSLNKEAELKISKGKMYIKNLRMHQREQEIRLDGVASRENDVLNLNFNNFNLSSLDGLTKPAGVSLAGSLSGLLTINSLFKNPYLSADIKTSSILYNQQPIGQLHLVSLFDPLTNVLRLNANLSDGERLLDLRGTYNMNRPTERLNVTAKLQNSNIALFQPFLKSLVSNLQGSATAELTIKGDLDKPRISGTAQFNQAKFTVNYLNTNYTINDVAELVDNKIRVQNFRIVDSQHNIAIANGSVDLNKLTDPSVGMDIRATNFHILNTNMKQNNLYYGTAYGSGTFSFHGPVSSIDIDIKASSNENTKITIPFNSAANISDSDFIQFASPEQKAQKEQAKGRIFQGISLNMDLTVTPVAELNINTDLGAVSGRGRGLMTLKISNLGDFEMFGDFISSSGKFTLKAQDYFNKVFELQEGGTIRWAGKPAEGVVNLKASYQQRTSIAPLYNAAGRNANEQRVLAQADMNIKGILSRPEITFDLNFPQDPYVKDELQGFLSDANNINQQALSLIVRRSFTASTESDFSKEVNSTLLSAGTEIAFNQLNNIIASSINVNFLDLNIRSLNDASASLRLFNDRLILTGGVSDRRNLQLTDLNVFSDRVATDAELAYYLRKDGRLILRASNRLNTRNFLLNPNQDYVTALGLVYRREFNSFAEYLRYIFLKKQKEESQK